MFLQEWNIILRTYLFAGDLAMLSLTKSTQCQKMGLQMNDEMERDWKGMVVVQ